MEQLVGEIRYAVTTQEERERQQREEEEAAKKVVPTIIASTAVQTVEGNYWIFFHLLFRLSKRQFILKLDFR